MSGREEDKREKAKHNSHSSGAAGIPQRADPACSEEAELFTDSGAGAGLCRSGVPVRSGIYRQHPAVLPTGRADLRGGENGEKERVRCDYERRTSGKT